MHIIAMKNKINTQSDKLQLYKDYIIIIFLERSTINDIINEINVYHMNNDESD